MLPPRPGGHSQLRYETVTMSQTSYRGADPADRVDFRSVGSRKVFERLAHLVIRRRRWIVAAWILLFLFGIFTTSKIGKRWFESFSIPGYSAYEANQRTLKTFGSGEQAPLVVVFEADGRRRPGARDRGGGRCAGRRQPGLPHQHYFSTGSNAYVSKDRHTTFAEIYPPGLPGFDSTVHVKKVRAAIEKAAPAGRDGPRHRPRSPAGGHRRHRRAEHPRSKS